MDTQLEAKPTAVPARAYTVSRSQSFERGRIYPNLVTIRDSGKSLVEFRVQCEVELEPLEADLVEAAMAGPGSNRRNLDAALGLLVDHAQKVGSSEAFKQILKLAVEDQPGYLKP